jgi:hypothetical protein
MSKSHRRDPALDRLRHKIVADRKGKRRGWHRRVLFLQHLITKRVARRHGLGHVVVFDGVPCTVAAKLVLVDCARNGWGGVLVSSDRRDNPHTERLLHKLGLHTPKEIIELHARGVPGYGPADPVELSSHCGYSDGVSYPEIQPGGHLPHPRFQLGRDVTEWDQLIAEAHHLGYDLVQPYDSGDEEHHVNERSDPKRRLIERGLL